MRLNQQDLHPGLVKVRLGGSDVMQWYLLLQVGGGNEPIAANPLAIGLAWGGITRIGIEGMSVVLDLVAVGCRHRRQRTWERGGAGRIT